MEQDNQTRNHLLQRRDEINDQLARLSAELRHELDHDPEEQAIEIEHDEVAMTMGDHLRKELSEIEERLSEIGG